MQSERTVDLLFAGAGSVGSKAIESVVRTTLDPKAGFKVGRLAIVDEDVLEAGNLMRHEGLPAEVGLEKTELMANRIRSLAPSIELELVRGSIHEDDHGSRVEALVASSHVVIASFDNDEARFALNAMCARRKRPLLVTEVLSGGIGAWFFAANHGEDGPCLLDIARARGHDMAAVGRSKKKIDYTDPASRIEAARVPADDWSCGLAAMLLAREVVLAARAGGVPASTPPVRLVAFQAVADESVKTFFQYPLQVTRIAAPKRADCVACAPVVEPTAAEHAANLAFFEEK